MSLDTCKICERKQMTITNNNTLEMILWYRRDKILPKTKGWKS